MLLTGKVAVIFGGNGATGSTITQAMACEGTYVCLGARSQEKLDRTISVIQAAGGTVETFIIDVLDEHNASRGVTRLAQQTDGIDVVVDTTGFMHEQGKHLDTLSPSEFMSSIIPFLSTRFNIAKAITPHVGGNCAGVIFSVVAPTAPMAMPDHPSRIVGCARTEAFIKALASEVRSANIRVVDVRSHATVDAIAAGSYTGETFSAKTQSMSLAVDQWLGDVAQSTMLARLPTLAQIAEVIAFLSSDHASVMTATVVDITGGATHGRLSRISLRYTPPSTRYLLTTAVFCPLQDAASFLQQMHPAPAL